MHNKVIVAHPGRQHSYRLASALKHAGLLDEYITTVYYRSPYSLLGLMAKLAPGDNGERIRGRYNPDLEDCDVKQFFEFRGIAETFIWRLKEPFKYSGYMKRTSRLFGIRVAKEAIKRNVDAVVCYDGQSRDCFSYLKMNAPHIKRILDVSIAPRPYVRYIYEKAEAQKADSYLRDENKDIWNCADDERAREEFSLANHYLAPSEFVSNGLTYMGVRKELILRLPYGCNFNFGQEVLRHKFNEGVRFLFVGQCVARKGLQDLAVAMDKLKSLSGFSLTIAGKFNPSDAYMMELAKDARVNVLGLVSHERIKELCIESDVFVFPSYAEGMSLACLEAMGSGLPIICTPNSGLTDLVTNGRNGYLFEAGDTDSLAKLMKHFIEKPELSEQMGQEAFRTARSYTWDRYEARAEEIFRRVVLPDGQMLNGD